MTEGDFVAIIGLGLIGGSLARDLAARGTRVRAYDRDRASLADAIAQGVVECALDADLGGVRDASAIVIAVPVDAAVEVLERIAPLVQRDALVTDVGSTKTGIVACAARLGLERNFVGAHPLAGDHRSGWPAARAGLLCGARVYLCPTAATEAALVERASDFWAQFGAQPTTIAPARHDEQLAYTSHLPQFVSIGLALALARRGVERRDLGPGGRDVTRLAGSSPEMWTAIARENADALHDALLTAERELAGLRGALSGTSGEALHERLAAAHAWFEV